MKWFSIILALGILALASAPFWLLAGRADDVDTEGMIISYGTYAAKVKSLDPATCGDATSAGIQGSFYESLMTYDFLARPMELACQLAAEFPTVSKDKLTYTFKIKKGVKYHRNPCFGFKADGEPNTRTVTAHDFVLAFKRIADAHINTDLAFAFIQDKIVGISEYREKTKTFAKGDFSRYDKLNIDGIRAVDALTLEIKLTQPWPQLLYVMAINNYAPIPREVINYWLSTQKKGDQRVDIPLWQRSPEITSAEIKAVVGTGAYYLEKFVDGGDIILQKNPDFREDYYPQPPKKLNAHYKKLIAEGLYQDAGKQLPMVDRFELKHVPDPTPMWMMFLCGQSDAAAIPREVFSAVISPTKDLTDTWAKKGIRLKKYTSPAIYWLVFNMEDPVLSASKHLRQALQLAYNVKTEIRLLQNDRGIRAKAYVPKDFIGYAEAPSPYAKYDLKLAKQKLALAKKELAQKNLLVDGDIPPLTLELGGKDARTRERGEFAQQQFKQLGITLNIKTNDWPTLQMKVHNKQCQMYTMGWHADYPDPENFLQLYYSPNIQRGTNNSNFSNPEFDRLFKQAAVMQPGPKRKALYLKMLNILNEDCPVLLQSEPVAFVLIQPWLRNSYPHPIGYGYRKYRGLDVEQRQKLGGGR